MHIEYLQTFLLKFDVNRALEETDLIGFFIKNFKPSIKAWTEEKRREYDTWEEVIKNTLKANVKTTLLPISYIRKLDHRCQQESRPVYVTIIKVQTQENLIKDPRNKKPKLKARKL